MATKYTLTVFILVCAILTQQISAKRRGGSSGGGGSKRGGGGGGSSHTTPRSSHQNNQDHYNQQTNTYQTGNNNPSAPLPPQNNNQGIGFDNVQRGSAPYPVQQTNTYQTGNHNPSAPFPSQNNNQGIGFDNVQRGSPPYPVQQNNPIGFENVHQRISGGQNSGFDNVNNRVPNQNQPPGGGFPYQNNNPNRFGGQNPYQQSGHYPNQNPTYNQPGNYYTPHYNQPNGIPPQIYQPAQQSGFSGSSVLGYAGTFAGGFLIGKLTSGGGGGSRDSDDRQYTVHHYHNNRDEVPQKLLVKDNGVVTCAQNETKDMCIPNTFPLCLSNGTIMCVTHLPYTTPCGSNSSLACVVTVLPCPNNTSCNTGNLTTTAVYVPCISNLTILRSTQDPLVVNPNQSNKVELCVTAIAEPKVEFTRAGAYMNLIYEMLKAPIDVGKNYTQIANATATTSLPYLNENETTSRWI